MPDDIAHINPSNAAGHLPRLNLVSFALPLALFWAFAAGRIGTLMGQDEISHYFKVAYLLFNEGYSHPEQLITFSPHGYPLLLWGACSIFGEVSFMAMRIVGIICWTLAISFVVWRSRRISSGLVLCCMPAACQAAVLLDIDETLLVPTCIMLWQASVCFLERQTWGRAALPAIMLCLCLWCRLTTPFIICAVMLLLCRNWRLLLSYAAGMVLFLLSWWIYCHFTGVNFIGPFGYLLTSFMENTSGSRAGGLSRMAQSILYLCLWGMNPMLIALFLLDGWKRLRSWIASRHIDELDSAWLCGAAILLGYTLVGGSLFGFPKYQCPAFPFVALSIASRFDKWHSPRENCLHFAAATVCVMICVSFLYGDPLLLIRSTLRNPHASASIASQMVPLSILLSYVLAFCVPFLMLRKRTGWKLALLLPAIVFNLCFSYRQNMARYATGYIYGELGECKRLAERIRKRGLEDKLLFLPAEVSHFLGGTDERSLAPGEWNDLDALTERIRKEKPAVVAYSYLVNRHSVTLAILCHNALQETLKADYIASQDASMTYWIRKE